MTPGPAARNWITLTFAIALPMAGEPQESTNYEVGIRQQSGAARSEAALFHIDVDDELTPFELPVKPGRRFYNNADSSTRVDSSRVSNLRVGDNGFYDGWEIAPFLGINNLFDESYNDNIRINAFGGRYYEPAPERNAYIGVSIRASFDA